MLPRSHSLRRSVLGASAFLAAGCAIDPAGICNSDVEDCEIDQAEREVVYGVDDRKEYSDPTVSALHEKWADSVGLLFIDPDATGTSRCTATTCTLPWASVSEKTTAGNPIFGMCAGEPFGPTATLPNGQARALTGACTAFLVAPDLMATASHCFTPDDTTIWETEEEACAQLKVAFDYHADATGQAPKSVAAEDVYSCSSIVASVRDASGAARTTVPNGRDYALFKLDRAVTGRSPLPIRRVRSAKPAAPLALIGHPASLPLKISSGGRVEDTKLSNVLLASVDAFGGNSGSPVFNRDTGLVEGLLESGNDDFKISFPASDPNGCLLTTKCAETGCTGADRGDHAFESVNRSTLFASLVPDQSPRAFSASTPTIDATYSRVAGGDFDGDGIGDVLFHGADGAADAIWYGNFSKTPTSRAVTVPDAYGLPLVGDFDGDGKSDVFWYRSGTGQDRIWWGDAARAKFGTAANTTLMKEDGAGYSPIVGDFDGDGDADILFYGRGTTAPAEKIWWSNRNRNGQKSGVTPSFTSQAKTVSATRFFPIAGDFDADGKDDIFWFEPGNVNASFWRHTTGQTFTTTKLTLPATLVTSHRAQAGDFDGNGAVDLLFYAPGATADHVFWFRTDQRGKYFSKTVSLNGTYRPAVGDFNGDTAADVLFYGTGTSPDHRLWGRLL